jgi:uncharacterized protein (TIGR03086 family)
MGTDPVADLPLRWDPPAGERTPGGRVRYRGPLAGADRALHLHLGFDGAGPPFAEVALERDDDGSWTAEVPGTDGHLLLDCAVATGDLDWDNNDGADYRLWIGLDPVDSHVHVREPGRGSMGSDSLRTALASGGMTHGLVSWQDNRAVDELAGGLPWLTRLVWVGPKGPDVDDLRRRLAEGAVGLKLHPSYDDYPADTPLLDPFLAVAAEHGVPVTVHTAPGPSDPDLVARLAERFPSVPFVLYHTFLGFPEGRRRAARHAQRLANLHLETSWCASAEVERLLGEVGPDRVLFGSDAAVDGPAHFVRTPPNIELTENYNQSLLRLARRLPEPTLRAFLEENTRRLFGLAPARALPVRPPEVAPGRVEVVPGRVEVTAGPAPAELLAPALDQAERVAALIGAEHLGRPTPCAEWDVQAVLGHLVAVVRRALRVAEGRPVPAAPGVAVLDARGRWRSRFAATARDARRAWPDAPPGDVPAPWGLVPPAVALSGFVLEVVVHTHDLAVGAGIAEPLDERLAAAALPIAQRLVPAGLRAGGTAFAAPADVPDDADAYLRLAAFLGRRPG